MTKPSLKPKAIKITYRGWQGHFICNCRWHLNTLVQLGRRKVVVSTVGQYEYPKAIKADMKKIASKYGRLPSVPPTPEDQWEEIGLDRKYETMCFYAKKQDPYNDADVTRGLDFFGAYNNEDDAQVGHMKIVKQVCDYLLKTRR